jgi:hypothetical protein
MTDELCDTALETIPISATFQGFEYTLSVSAETGDW